MIGAYAIGSYPIAGINEYRVTSEKIYASYFTSLLSQEEEEKTVWSRIVSSTAVGSIEVLNIGSAVGTAGWISTNIDWSDPTIGWTGAGSKVIYISDMEILDGHKANITASSMATTDTSPVGSMATASRASSSSMRTYSPFLAEYID